MPPIDAIQPSRAAISRGECELLRPRGEAPEGKPRHRPPPLQIRQKDRRRTHPAERRQHPRQGVSALPALQGTAEAEARRMERRRFPLSLSLQIHNHQPKAHP